MGALQGCMNRRAISMADGSVVGRPRVTTLALVENRAAFVGASQLLLSVTNRLALTVGAFDINRRSFN